MGQFGHGRLQNLKPSEDTFGHDITCLRTAHKKWNILWQEIKDLSLAAYWSRVEVEIAQLVKVWISSFRDCGFEPYCRSGVFFWYGPLASLSLYIAIACVRITTLKNGGPNQWIRVKSLHVCSISTSPFSQPDFGGWLVNKWLRLTNPSTSHDHSLSLVPGASRWISGCPGRVWVGQANLHYKLPTFPAAIWLAR